MLASLYTLSDAPAGLVVFMSAVTLYITGREFNPLSAIGRALANICFWAAISIALVACIYWSFAISVDFGLAVRGWLKAGSGLSAFISAALGARFIILIRRWS